MCLLLAGLCFNSSPGANFEPARSEIQYQIPAGKAVAAAPGYKLSFVRRTSGREQG
jgi:hypothetical protein